MKLNSKAVIAAAAIVAALAYWFLHAKPEAPKTQPEPAVVAKKDDVVKEELPKQDVKSSTVLETHPHAVPAISRYDKPLYPIDFSNFSYVNPNAPKGGTLKLGTVGTFDSLNVDIVKGIAAEALTLTTDPLMRRASGEPFSMYGVLAQFIEVAPDYSSVTFFINPAAKFHDGSSVTAEDVKFSIEIKRDKGLPRYKQFYSRIAEIHVIDSHTIKLDLIKNADGNYDPELPLIIANLRVLQKKQLESLDFASTGLTTLIGTGPYKVKIADQGRSVTYERDPNYWGKDLPVNRGYYNFENIQIEYFKNVQAQFQSFTAGEFDIYFETNPNQWETGYNFSALKDGRVKKIEAEHKRQVAVRTLIFNMRRPLFSDIRVRKALTYAFDFETLNKIVFSGSMKRPHSLFANTYLAHEGAAVGLEKEILSKFSDKLPKGMMDGTFTLPSTDGNGDQRANLEVADKLLKEAGWTIKKGKRVNASGQLLTLEIMIKDPKMEKIGIAYRESLKKLGVELVVRMIDTVQYENRVVESNFDMIIHTWANSLSPGNEQAYYFSAKNADIPGSSNYIGIKDEVAESFAQMIAATKDGESLKASVHALDRYVMYNYFQIPLAYDNVSRWAYWVEKLAYPEVDPLVGTNVMEWGWSPAAAKH
jgi:microcin C transport system substrate-binding protein